MKTGRKESLAGRGDLGAWIWKPRFIEDQFSQSVYGVYDFIYGKYQAAPPKAPNQLPEASRFPKLYKRYELENGVMSEFNSIDRIKLMITIFEGAKSDNCCGMNLSQLVSNDCILGAFPLHNNKEKVMLEKKWLRAHQLPWNQPIWDVKSYFGEKVALYFAFIGHLNSWLMAAAVFGLIVYVDMAVQSSYFVGSQFWFGIFLACWSTLLLEFWKRQESTLVMMWGMTGFEEAEPDRPEFQGETIASPVNGEDETYFPDKKMAQALSKTMSVLLGHVAVSVGVFASVFALSGFMNHDLDAHHALATAWVDFAQLIPALLCAAVIMVGSRVFSGIAIQLTNMENHKTDTQYEDSVIIKTFVFEFFNSYSAPFYVIFLKQYAPGDSCVGGCLRELHYLMGAIFVSLIIVQSAVQVYTPVTRAKEREEAEKEGADPSKALSAIEKQFMLEEYDQMFGAFNRFKETAILFGYAVLFSTAFPVAPLLAFIATYFEIRVDSWVLLQKSRRVVPSGVEDIGTWQSVFECLSGIAAITNMGIIFLVSETDVNTAWVWRLIHFLLYEHGIFMGQMFFALLVDDVPMSTATQLDRQTFLHAKLIENAPDDDLEAVKDEGEDEENLDFIDEIYDDDEDPVL
jgi:anoctamin-10/anoctamin-7